MEAGGGRWRRGEDGRKAGRIYTCAGKEGQLTDGGR